MGQPASHPPCRTRCSFPLRGPRPIRGTFGHAGEGIDPLSHGGIRDPLHLFQSEPGRFHECLPHHRLVTGLLIGKGLPTDPKQEHVGPGPVGPTQGGRTGPGQVAWPPDSPQRGGPGIGDVHSRPLPWRVADAPSGQPVVGRFRNPRPRTGRRAIARATLCAVSCRLVEAGVHSFHHRPQAKFLLSSRSWD